MFRFADFEFEPESARLCCTREGQQVELQLRNKVANLLHFFLSNPNQVISKATLLNALWQHSDYRESALTQSIRELRVALNDDAKNPQFIKTIPQRGYQWICDVVSNSENEQVDEQPSAQDVSVADKLKARFKQKKQYVYFTLVVFIVALCGLFVSQNNAFNHHISSSEQSEQRKRVVVFPFVNDTHDNTMAWLELGLSDMLSIDLKRSQLLDVISPAHTNMLLLENELPWPLMPVQIRQFMKVHHADVGLFASVRVDQGRQVIDFQLIEEDGKIKQSSITAHNLASKIDVISEQVLKLITQVATSSELSAEPDLSAMAIAKGMQALQTTGADHALRYFMAANTIKPSAWATAYEARSRIAIGQWSQAQSDFEKLAPDTLKQDPLLKAFVFYWLANLAIKQGDTEQNELVEKSIQASLASYDAQLIAKSYRIKAQLAWQNMQWHEHQRLINKAEQYLATQGTQVNTADKLFYLGQPSNIGLEKSPYNDLIKNKQHLTRALGFYRQLGNQAQVAATELAIAQNYYFDLTHRKQALDAALTSFKALNLPYELAMAQLYAGFYHIQLHQGHLAQSYFEQAKQGLTNLGAKNDLLWAEFYLAFAHLDQGLDQSSQGRHGQNPAQLNKAITQLSRLVASSNNPHLKSSSLVFLGWAYSDLEQPEKAKKVLKQAMDIASPPYLKVTHAYARYSMMALLIKEQKYELALTYSSSPWLTRLEPVYLAIAQAKLGRFEQAAATLKEFKQTLPHLFQANDQVQLLQYQQTAKTAQPLSILIPKAHLVYCESDWMIEP